MRQLRASKRPTVTRFRLARPAAVTVLVRQQAPLCRRLGRYTFRGSRGVNVIRLHRAVGGHRIGPGTYRLSGRTAGHAVFDVRVRVIRRRGRIHVVHRDLADACSAAAAEIAATTAAALGIGAPTPGSAAHAAGAAAPIVPPASGHKRGGRVGGLLPPTLGGLDMLDPLQTSPLLRAVLFALLGIAIALFAAASAPERLVPAGAGTVVSRHRAALTLAGLALLVAVGLVSALA
jgi:hypothetical protein